MGKELALLQTNVEAELFRFSGQGCLTHMWFGGDWPGYERTRIRVYVDEETVPGIEMELGLGHGMGFGDTTAPWGIAPEPAFPAREPVGWVDDTPSW